MVTQFITSNEIIYINQALMRQYHGQFGIQYPSGLAIIINQPQQSYAGQAFYPTIWDKAAYLIQRLTNMHIFLDGNKRTAYLATALFFAKNGYQLTGPVDQLTTLMVHSATHPNQPTWTIQQLKKYTHLITKS